MPRSAAGFPLIGAVYGAVLVGAAKTFFSENFVEYWLYFIGGLFMFVVMFLPRPGWPAGPIQPPCQER